MTPESEQHQASLIVRLLQALTGPWTKKNLISWVLLIGGILFLKGCLLDQYSVPTGSMEPTIHGDPRFFRGDRVLVNKWIFGPRIPFTTTYLTHWGAPKRWEIVVFHRPKGDGPKILVKRVVGLPGETVQIKEDGLYINGQRTEPPAELRNIIHYTTQFAATPAQQKIFFLKLAQQNMPLPILNPNEPTVVQLYEDMNRCHDRVKNKNIDLLLPETVEEMCQGVSPITFELIQSIFAIQQPPLQYGIRPEPEFSQVPAGHYLLLGDNSPQSLDGRVWGFVPEDNLYGRACGIWWPLPRRRDFTGFSHTWWGMSLLIGIPLLLAALEIRHYRKERKQRA